MQMTRRRWRWKQKGRGCLRCSALKVCKTPCNSQLFAMKIVIYYTSITATVELDKKQNNIKNILDGKNIPYILLDLAADANLKDEMREKIGDPKAMPPQIFNGDQYCGDFVAFEQAVESEKLEAFLKLDNRQIQMEKNLCTNK
ncbi:SH3 domain-binding glutamic acid-rich-like protein 3 [Narcine bancroftii]|uniref:SH3 domain-binding glutamic acid-rich-like protein 3 n=1 Tax=Narcine bancroftii TaxID=1343680 RepID=UPI0038321987